MCVQKIDDSQGLAIRITYRISLRSSSVWEPRHPLLKVVMVYCLQDSQCDCLLRFMVLQFRPVIDWKIDGSSGTCRRSVASGNVPLRVQENCDRGSVW